MASKYFTYIAECSDGTFYTGYTNDIQKRQQAHNEGRGARYTKSRLPIKIVYQEEFKNRSEAMRREYEIKQLNKIQKVRLIKPQAS